MAQSPVNSWLKMMRLIRRNISQLESLNFQAGLRHFSKEGKAPRQIPREKPAIRQRKGSGLPLLVIPLTCVGLGTWQIQRREWKLNLIKELEKRLHTVPTELPQDLSDLSDMEYYRVKVRGTFDHNKELFIGPRTNVHDPETMGSQRSKNIGVNVVTPFKLADREESILVNRGHVPFKEQPPQLRKEGQVDGEVELIGVVRTTDRQPLIGQDPQDSGYWVSRNVEEMAQVAETAPVFLDADSNSTVPGGPSGGQTRVTLRNEHLTYIITWYSLAVLTSYLWYKNYRSPKPHAAMVNYLKKEHKKL